MKLYAVCLLMCSFAACQNNRSSSSATAVDTIVATGVGHDAPAAQEQNTGVWTATIRQPKNGKQERLIVSGVIDVGNGSAIASLKKRAPAPNPHALVLALSHEPRESKEQPVKVRYEEELTATSRYDTIRIMNNSRTVATITHITRSN